MSIPIVFGPNNVKQMETDCVRCGEVFLTNVGCVVFQCTLCDNKHDGYTDYWNHVMKEHYLTRSDVQFSADDLRDSSESSLFSIDLNSYQYLDENEKGNSFQTVNIIQDDVGSDVLQQDTALVNDIFGDDTIGFQLNDNEGDFASVENLIEFVANELLVAETDGMQMRIEETANDFSQNKIEKTEADLSVTEGTTKILPSSENRQGKLNQPPFRRFLCSKCGRDFTSKTNLKLHLKRHERNLRFKCDQCTRAFISKHELKEHIRRHANERLFLCADCGHTFVTSSELTCHTKRVHKKLRNYTCGYCDKDFCDSRLLQDHLNAHRNQRSYECSMCKATFSRQASFYNHKKLHANKREYVCSMCNARFNQSSSLFSHMKNKHNNQT